MEKNWDFAWDLITEYVLDIATQFEVSTGL
jgi:hypothetical protein